MQEKYDQLATHYHNEVMLQNDQLPSQQQVVVRKEDKQKENRYGKSDGSCCSVNNEADETFEQEIVRFDELDDILKMKFLKGRF